MRKSEISGLSVEIGRMMALAEEFQKQLADIKKDVAAGKREIQAFHGELTRFMAEVQTRTACQRLHEKLGRDFVARVELAPLKAVLNVIIATTATTICVALFNLILK